MTDGEPLSPTAAQAASDTWVVVGRLLRKLRSLGGDGDITPAQTSVLVRLGKQSPASASELAAVEQVRPQSMAKIVAALEESGLVQRNPDPDDGRRQLVTLTALGRERRQGVKRAREAWLARALQEQGTEEELQALIVAMGVLDKVAGS
ncbi:MarR family transcriptional regulator [Amycolatopsis acidicola]|uniref:MarR family transcriptional regulator n=1 Tax=Amycolatopsis acidicola TaxID=2596893 RepID=A0A5N0UYM5_9PSEU|nr:MarR family transcriptional regulator [Amycolatopsis acidicola]KAA9158744.1 MarR family transcriptional regulator [Amycolatopsis acidicola]